MLFVLSAATIPDIFRDYRIMQEGCAFFDRHAYPSAEAKFQELLRLGPKGGESDGAIYNLGCTWYMQGKYPQASAMFTHRPKQRDLKLKSMFNLANSLAMTGIAETDKTRKLQLLRNALYQFRAVLLQDPGDGDAKINYEIVRRYIQELEQPPPPPSSGKSGGGTGQDRQQGINSDVASRLLQRAQDDESSLMRQLPRQGKNDTGGKNEKDW